MLLPLPNELFDGGVVIASMYLNDDDTDGYSIIFRLLLLRPKSFYYEVLEMADGEVNYRNSYENIAEAVKEYEEG